MATKKLSSSTGRVTPAKKTRKPKPDGLNNTGDNAASTSEVKIGLAFLLESLIHEFRANTEHIPYQPKSIFPSEMFLFTTLVAMTGVDHIVESGGRAGGSTSYLSKLSIKIDSVSDSPVDGIKTHSGDGCLLVPKIISASKANKIAVLIDGPKDQAAVDLANEVLKDERVQFVAVHDLVGNLAAKGVIHSHDVNDLTKELDAQIGDYLAKYPKGPGLTIFSNAPITI